VDRDEALRLAPGMARPSGGYVYWDCRTDDARLTFEVVRAAAGFGAWIATRAEVRGLAGEGKTTTARVVDRLTGESLDVRARVVVNATGAWADRLLPSPSSARLRPSVGVHVVLDRRRIPIRSAVLIPSIEDRRSLFLVIPWGPRCTSVPRTRRTPGRSRIPPPTRGTSACLCPRSTECSTPASTRATSWPRGPASGRSWTPAGDPPGTCPAATSWVEDPGVVTITGGKLTTYRAMAEEVVDRICRTLGRGGRCRTTEIPLGSTRPLAAERERATARMDRLGLPPGTGARLVERFGDDWIEAARAIEGEPPLGEPVVPGLPVLRVETWMARRGELALTEEDVLVRRTRLATMDARAVASRSVW
jgi:glycerol-3-phosphate dehydrogenase